MNETINSSRTVLFTVKFELLHLKSACRLPKQYLYSCKQLHVSRRFLQNRFDRSVDPLGQPKKTPPFFLLALLQLPNLSLARIIRRAVAVKYGETLSNCPVIESICNASASGFQLMARVQTLRLILKSICTKENGGGFSSLARQLLNCQVSTDL